MFEPEEKELAYSNKGFDEVFFNFVGIEVVYSKCHSFFPSKSKLHMYIKSKCMSRASPSASLQLSSSIPIVVSRAIYVSLGLSLRFKDWTYITIAITPTPEYLPQISDPNSMAYLDTGCKVTLVDKYWLLKHLPNQKINIISTSLKVRGIGAFKYKSSELTALSLYFFCKNNIGKLIYILLQCEIHLVKSLYANLFIDNDIMSSEAIVINLGKNTVLIGACRVTINVNVKQRDQFLTKKLFTSQESIIPSCLEVVFLLVKLSLPDNQDFLFHPTPQANPIFYAHIIDYETLRILIKNAFDQPLCVPCRHKLGHLLNITYNNYFFIDN